MQTTLGWAIGTISAFVSDLKEVESFEKLTDMELAACILYADRMLVNAEKLQGVIPDAIVQLWRVTLQRCTVESERRNTP